MQKQCKYKAALEDLKTYENQTEHVNSAWYFSRNQDTIRSALKIAAGMDRPFYVADGLTKEDIERLSKQTPGVVFEYRPPETVWRPIETAPRDGTLIWAYLYQSGVRLVRWYTAEEIADHSGGIPEDWNPGWGEERDITEEWEPKFWLPYDALPPAPEEK